MRILLCLLIGLIAAMVSFGWRALSSGRAHDFDVATKFARKSTVVAFLIALISTTALFGWPWRPMKSSVAEEVSRTVVESVDEVVEVPTWFGLGKEKQTVKRDVPKTIIDVVQHPTTVYVFSIWMLIPMVVIGGAAALLQFKVLRFIWWWRG